MKFANCLTRALLMAVVGASPLAFGATAIYQGSLNGNPVTVKFDVLENSALVAHYIPCQTPKDEVCSGPGTYAFFYHDGTATLTYASKSAMARTGFTFYSGAENIQNGQLNGSFGFTGNIDLPEYVDEYDRMQGYQFSLTQYGANPVTISVSKNNVTGLSFPPTYQLNWSRENSQSPRGYDNGSVTLIKTQE